MRLRPMFTRSCGEVEPHASHYYLKHWRLIDLPLLRNPHLYPQEWDSRYHCPGVKAPGKTWAESLGLEIPDTAPGGHRIAGWSTTRGGRRVAENRNQIDYEGFYDNDAHRRSERG